MPTIADYLKYANLQMAAEAFIRNEKTNILADSGQLLIDALKAGNNHASKFTESQAKDFAAHWIVVDQCKNTSSGFSGTLFKCIEDDPATGAQKGELVISFRSTEFIDDAVNDCQTTNKTIANCGWGFGQIADMEKWYADLKADPSKLGNASFSVTGYSLGGHLATAFNLLRQEDVDKGIPNPVLSTYTFNGAGVGTLLSATSNALSNTIETFKTVLSNTGHNEALFSSAAIKNLYSSLAARQAGHVTTTVAGDMASPTATWLMSNFDVTSLSSIVASLANSASASESERQSAKLLYDAVLLAHQAQDEYFRIKDYSSGGSGTGTTLKKPDAMANMEGLNIDYWLAVLTAGQNTTSTNTVAPYNRLPGKSINNCYDVFGEEFANQALGSPSAVANSQLHSGEPQSIFIESQPIYRGTALWDAATESALYLDFKLLNDGYEKNDFGDTHSLVLIIDSLSVQAAFAKLCPTLTPEVMSDILKAASFSQTENIGSSQGKCEGDVLENVVDALGKTFGLCGDAQTVLQSGWQTMAPSLDGNTWWDTTEREKLYANLALITKFIDDKKLAGKVTIEASSASLADHARNEFSSFVALWTLSPFVLKSTDQTALDAVLNNGSLTDIYTQWTDDKALTPQQRAAGEANYSHLYLADRASMLSWINQAGQQNTTSVKSASIGFDQQWTFIDDATQRTIYARPLQPTPVNVEIKSHVVHFGSDLAETIYGGIENDHLYGGAGTDDLIGGLGDDYLEGNENNDKLTGGLGNDTLLGGTGNDTLTGGEDSDLLLGGLGTDTYVIATGDGQDWIEDSDGLGTITYDGLTLGSVGIQKKADNVWQETLNGKLTTYSLYDWNEGGETYKVLSIAYGNGGGLWVKHWQPGQLGITLPGAEATPPSPVLTILGDKAPIDADSGTDGIQYGYDALGNVLVSGEQTGRADTLYGSADIDLIKGLAGNDYLDGKAGNDQLYGDIGDDTLHGGADNDTLTGGAGDDELRGDAGDDTLILDGGLDRDRGFGGDGNDVLVARTVVGQAVANVFLDGGANNDILNGAAGNDVLLGGRGQDTLIGGEGDSPEKLIKWRSARPLPEEPIAISLPESMPPGMTIHAACSGAIASFRVAASNDCFWRIAA